MKLFGDLALSTPIIFTLLLTQNWGGRSAEDPHNLAVSVGRPPSLGGQWLRASPQALAGHVRHWWRLGPLAQEARKAALGMVASLTRLAAACV